MNIKRFSQIQENFEPTNEFITTVKATISHLPSDVEVEESVATVYWNNRIRLGKDNFSFDVWLSKVVIECVWKTLDDQGDVINEEDKVFTYESEYIKGSQPDTNQLQYTIRPESVEVYLNKLPGKVDDVEVYW